MLDSLGADLGYMKQSVHAVVQLNERAVRLNAVHSAFHHITGLELVGSSVCHSLFLRMLDLAFTQTLVAYLF